MFGDKGCPLCNNNGATAVVVVVVVVVVVLWLLVGQIVLQVLVLVLAARSRLKELERDPDCAGGVAASGAGSLEL